MTIKFALLIMIIFISNCGMLFLPSQQYILHMKRSMLALKQTCIQTN